MKLYMIRHGETDWNKERKLQGVADIELNAFGIYLAEETGKALATVPFDIAFTSPLVRAKKTAEIILKQHKDISIVEDKRIMEMSFGEFEGMCVSKTGYNVPDDNFLQFFEAPHLYKAPKGGESFLSVKKRVKMFINELFISEEHRDKTVLLSTHGAVLRMLINEIKGTPIEEFWKDGIHRNCAVTIIDVIEQSANIIEEGIVYYKEEVEPW